jgi:hypothetical protein
MFEHHISQEAFERLHVWCLAHCPAALEDPDFLAGLMVIVEEEVRTELARACWKRLRLISEPCRQ